MTKLRLIPYAVLAAGLFAAGGASAQSMWSIDQRQDAQQNRIEQGIRSGQITRSEAARLEQGERAIDRAQTRARADGVVTSQERARLDRMVDREGRSIAREGHDRQQAWDRGQDRGRTDGRRDGWNDRDGRNAWNRRDGNHNGWGQRDADRRDWGRNHNDGAGNHGRDHNGWNRGDHNNTTSNGQPRQWNGPRHDNGTATTTPGTRTHSWNGGSHTPRTGMTTPRTRPTAGTAPTSTRNHGGYRSTQPTTSPAATAPRAPRQQAAAPTRSANAGGRSWSGNR